MKLNYLYWMLSVFGFPIGGFAATSVASTNQGALASAIAGLIAGFVIGLGQWLAARPTLAFEWTFLSSIGLGSGAFVASALTQSQLDVWSLVAFGLVSGLVLGIAQAFHFNAQSGFLWAVSTAALWGVSWAITANVIVDVERGYVVFGLSGAIVYTALSGALLMKIVVGGNK